MRIVKDLTLKELCEIVNNHYYYYALYIFNPNIVEDIDKDFEKSKNSVFDFWLCNGDSDEEARFIAIGFKKEQRALPLWLIENKEWIIRIERSKDESKM